MIDAYQKTSNGRTIRFLHLATSDSSQRYSEGLFQGVLVDENLHTQKVNMNPTKMVSRGWKKVPEPMLTLKEQMLSDVTELNRQIASGTHVMRVGEVVEMIGKYAGLVALAEKADVCSGRKAFG
ncbi:hypothetical protein VPHD148_0159 [Vibrio phage D148]